jgi:hypothetical protein
MVNEIKSGPSPSRLFVFAIPPAPASGFPHRARAAIGSLDHDRAQFGDSKLHDGIDRLALRQAEPGQVVVRPARRASQLGGDAVAAQPERGQFGERLELGGCGLVAACQLTLAWSPGERLVEDRAQQGVEVTRPAVGPALPLADFAQLVAFHDAGHQGAHVVAVRRVDFFHTAPDGQLQVEAQLGQVEVTHFAVAVVDVAVQQVERIDVPFLHALAFQVAGRRKPPVDDALLLVVERMAVNRLGVLRPGARGLGP